MQLRDGGFMPTFIALPQARPRSTDVLLGAGAGDRAAALAETPAVRLLSTGE